MLRYLTGNSRILVSCALIGAENVSLQFLWNSLLSNNPLPSSSGVISAKGRRILSKQVKNKKDLN